MWGLRFVGGSGLNRLETVLGFRVDGSNYAGIIQILGFKGLRFRARLSIASLVTRRF